MCRGKRRLESSSSHHTSSYYPECLRSTDKRSARRRRRKFRGERERIAFLTPKTLVVTRARVLIEIAVLSTGGIVLAWDAAVVRVFGVVARAGAVGVIRVDEPVPVVVGAVSTQIDFALAGFFLTGLSHCSRAVSGARVRSASVQARAAGSSARAVQRSISTDLDVLGAAAGEQSPRHAKDEAPDASLHHCSSHHFGVGSVTMRW